MSTRSMAIAWSKRGVFLTAWAIVGIALWIPKLLGAVLLYGVALGQSTLKGPSAGPAGAHLRRAADFYQGFVDTMDSIGSPHPTQAAQTRFPPRPLLRDLAWAAFVWYAILASVGLIHPTPVDLASSLATASWPEMWSGAVEAVASIPTLFRG
jgi:hypothetical protein